MSVFDKAALANTNYLKNLVGVVKFNGYKTVTKPYATTAPIYIEKVFDLNGYTLSTEDKFKVGFDFYAEGNVASIGSLVFRNDDATLGNPNGGSTYSADENDIDAYIPKTLQSSLIDQENYVDTYRYAHVFILVNLVDGSHDTPIFFRNMKLFVGSTEISPISDHAIYVVTGQTISAVEYIVTDKTYTKWQGAKANFIGDSMTEAVCWGTSDFIPVIHPYHYLIGKMLGLSTVRNYGVSSSAISATSTSIAGSFVSRYAAMDNDADLIVVFGGTNDFGYNTPLGTIADTTDISFYGALHVLFEGLIAKYLGKRIVYITPLHRDGENTPNTADKKLVDYVNAIKEVAAVYAIPVVDAYTISNLTPAVAAMKTAYINDGVHPNEAGHEILAKNIVGQFLNL